MHYYLVTCFNNEAYIDDAIDSIRRQYVTLDDFYREARVLIVDDASTDSSPVKLRALTARHRNILAYENPRNQGIGRNRNFLLDWLSAMPLAPTDFVLFLDGDDLLAKDHIANKMSFFGLEPGLEVVGGQLELFYEDGSDAHRVESFSFDPEVQAIAHMFECHFYVSNAMFRASVFMKPGVRFPETSLGEDWLFFAMHPLKKRHAPVVTLHYRRHTRNATRANSGADQAVRRQIRHLAHRLGALRMGLVLSDRECELMDLVGYLTFKFVMVGGQPMSSASYMPWFEFLAEQESVVANWAATSQELDSLFKRMLDCNDRIQAYNPRKLATFLNQMLTLADHAVQ